MNFAKQVSDLSDESVQGIIRFVNTPVDAESLKREYNDVFNTYYSTELHSQRLGDLLSHCL